MSKRRYQQNCALALANDVIGERWTLLLIRDLLIFPRRFKELLESLKGMGTNLLATRLKDLEASGLVERRQGEAGSMVYALTPRGRALEPAVLELIRWGFRYGPGQEADNHHRDDWDLLALKALFQPARALDLSAIVQFRKAGFVAWVRVHDQAISFGPGVAEDANVEIEGTVSDLFLKAANPADLQHAGHVQTLRAFMATFGAQA